MTYPTKFPLATSNYEDFFFLLKSDELLRVLLTDWDVSMQTYDSNSSHPDSAVFRVTDEFKLSDLKQTWFTTPRRYQKWSSVVNNIKLRLIEKNKLTCDVDNMGFSFVIMVPMSQTREHIDRGSYAGTSIIFPILGTCEFTYNNNEKRFLIDTPTFASNTVWYNFRNNTNALAIALMITLPLDISELKEENSTPVLEMT